VAWVEEKRVFRDPTRVNYCTFSDYLKHMVENINTFQLLTIPMVIYYLTSMVSANRIANRMYRKFTLMEDVKPEGPYFLIYMTLVTLYGVLNGYMGMGLTLFMTPVVGAIILLITMVNSQGVLGKHHYLAYVRITSIVMLILLWSILL
jgi:hypothetical protein